MGRQEEAERALTIAVDMLQKLRDEWPTETKYTRQWAGALLDRSNVRWLLKSLNAAEADLEAALRVQRQLVAQGSEVADEANLARMLISSALLLRSRRPEQADQSQAEGIRRWEDIVQRHPTFLPYRHGLASALHNRARELMGQGQLDQAEALLRRALQLRQPLKQETLTLLMRWDLVLSHELLAGLLASRRQLDAAVAEWRAALTVLEMLHTEQPSAVTYLTKASEVLSRASRAAADQDWEAELMRWEERLARWLTANEDADVTIHLGGFQCYHGGYLMQRSKVDAALAGFERAVRTLTPIAEPEPPRPQARQFLANANVGRAMALMRLGSPQEAVLAWDAALRWDRSPQRPVYQLERARTLVQTGDVAGALAAAAAAERPNDPDHFLRRATVHALAGAQAADDSLRDQCEAGALLWLRRLRQAGRCNEGMLRLLRGGGDWAWLRTRPAFQAWLAEK